MRGCLNSVAYQHRHLDDIMHLECQIINMWFSSGSIIFVTCLVPIDRAKLWSNQMPQLFHQLHCSDGFSLNLCTVLLRLCQPFAQPGSVKMLKVQPTYCLATVGEARQLVERGVHMKGAIHYSCRSYDVHCSLTVYLENVIYTFVFLNHLTLIS